MFECDTRKSASNLAKQGIDFDQAQALWDDPDLLEIPAKTEDEPRSLLIGGGIEGKHWSAVVTHRGDVTRQAPQELHLARVLLTLSSGKVVHDAHFGIGDVEAGKLKLAEDFQRIAKRKEWIN